MRNYALGLSFIALLTLSACGTIDNMFSGGEENKLEGERLSLYDFEKTLRPDGSVQFGMDSDEQALITLPDTLKGGIDETISLNAPWENKFWPQVGGYPNHTMKHVAFNEGEPRRIWSTSIGRGSSTNTPLTSAPVIAEGMVFTLDTRSNVQATDSATGKKLWSQNILKAGEDESVLGGGIAFSGGQLFATNGFNEIVSLNPQTGKILWRTETKSPIRGAPAAVPGRLFVITMDNKTLALNASDGQILWQHSGLSGDTSLLGATTPAIDRNAVITAYSSGEIYALRIENGQELWVDNLAPIARSAGRMQLSDIRALPVVDDGMVIATSHANRISANDIRTGLPQWNAAIGSSSTPWVSGNRIYIIGLQGALISLDKASGEVIWQTALPRFEDADDREDPITWQGPLLAGNRLMAFASTGEVYDINPVDGSIIRTWDVGQDMRLPPAVAGGVLYVVDDGGTLRAFR
jgi:outer membrane protein assembly factor BamB